MSEPDAFERVAAEMTREQPMLAVIEILRRIGWSKLTPAQEMLMLDTSFPPWRDGATPNDPATMVEVDPPSRAKGQSSGPEGKLG